MVISVVADSGWTLSDCSRWESKELQKISRRAREKRRYADKTATGPHRAQMRIISAREATWNERR